MSIADEVGAAYCTLTNQRQDNAVTGDENKKDVKKPYFIVEGTTDEEFYVGGQIRRLAEGYNCKAAVDLGGGGYKRTGDVAVVPTDGGDFQTEQRAAPILEGLEGKSFVKDAIENNRYPGARGAIDKDFDSPDDYRGIQGLYVTDTHDMETLLISTIKPAVLWEQGINPAYIDRALFISYQISLYKRFQDSISRNPRENVSSEVKKLFIVINQYTKEWKYMGKRNFGESVDSWIRNDDKINFKEFCREANSVCRKAKKVNFADNKEGSKKFVKAVNDSLSAMTGFGIDETGFIKASITDYRRTVDDSKLYDCVNGHDLVSLMGYLSRKTQKEIESLIRTQYQQNPRRPCRMFATMIGDSVLESV